MMVYEYGGQLNGLFKHGKRGEKIDKEKLKAEIEETHRRVGK